MDNIRILLADDELWICRMLEAIIRQEHPDFTIAGIASNGIQLEEMIRQLNPDIVISDICMPGRDGLEVLKNIREQKITCKYVIISGHQQFEYAYSALKYGVDDFLLKPIDSTALNATLSKVLAELNHVSSAQSEVDIACNRRFFLVSGLKQLTATTSTEWVNHTYGTIFQPGDLFRGVYIKQDFDVQEAQIPKQIGALGRKIEGITTTELSGLCHDIVCDIHRDGVAVLLAYPRENEREILNAMPTLIRKIQNAIDLFERIYITIGIGQAVSKIPDIAITCESAKNVLWRRVLRGVNQVYSVDSIQDSPTDSAYQKKLDILRNRILKAFELVDVDEVSHCISELFNMPIAILDSRLGLRIFEDVAQQLFAINGELIPDREKIEDAFALDVSNAYSLRKLREIYISHLSDILNTISLNVQHSPSPIIRTVKKHIEEHYTEHLSVDAIANEVHLSPGYLSSIFKKEVGINFTEYCNTYRLNKAKELLRNSNMNINEIAEAVGIPNTRYFSKQFKSYVGITPKEFRKIRG